MFEFHNAGSAGAVTYRGHFCREHNLLISVDLPTFSNPNQAIYIREHERKRTADEVP